MTDRYLDTPNSRSTVTLKLEQIQKRCSDLLDDPDSMLELALDEPDAPVADSGDPYNRQS